MREGAEPSWVRTEYCDNCRRLRRRSSRPGLCCGVVGISLHFLSSATHFKNRIVVRLCGFFYAPYLRKRAVREGAEPSWVRTERSDNCRSLRRRSSRPGLCCGVVGMSLHFLSSAAHSENRIVVRLCGFYVRGLLCAALGNAADRCVMCVNSL